MAAKQKPAILKTFFEGHRRKAFLANWNQTRDKRGIDTIKLEMRLPLLNESVTGMNEEIGDPFSLMAKDTSKTDRSVVNVEIKGMTLEVFSTGTSKDHWTSTAGAHFKKVWLTTEGEEDKKEVNLHVVIYVPGSVEFRDWAWIHIHKDFHLEAVYSQSEMELRGNVDEDEELEDISDKKPEEKELDPDAEPVLAPPRRPGGKSGPKDLAAFHAAQPS